MLTVSRKTNGQILAWEHAEGLAKTGHFPAKYTQGIYDTAMDIIEESIDHNHVRKLQKVYKKHGVPFCPQAESAVNSICMKYWSQLNHR